MKMVIRLAGVRVRRTGSLSARMEKLFRAARKTPFYRDLLEGQSLADSVELWGANPVALEQFLERRADFRNPVARPQVGRAFWSPVNPPPRTAVLLPGFRQSESVRVIADGWIPDIQRFAPEALAGPADRLRLLAETLLDQQITIDSSLHFVTVFTGLELGPLDEDDRDLFWRAFQAPVYEQMLGFRSEPLAWECEAHDGLHIRENSAIFELEGDSAERELLLTSLEDLEYPVLRLATGLTGDLETEACDCGVLTRRLMRVRPLAARLEVAQALSA